MKTLLSNINHAIRNNEIVSIGGGTFEAHELYKIIQLYSAAQLAKYALLFDEGSEPSSTDEPSSTMLQNTYFGGVHPLDNFPSIRGKK